jgi:hypothetical protein
VFVVAVGVFVASVGMDVLVVAVGMRMAVSVACGARVGVGLEDFVAVVVVDVVAVNGVGKSWDVFDEEAVGPDFDGKVLVAEEPTEPSGVIGAFWKRNDEDGLGALFDDVAGAVVDGDRRVVGDRFFEVEGELGAVGGGGAPATFEKGVPIEVDGDLGE